MLFVCVDDENIQLPPFITSVPTIYLINDKKIVVDEAQVTGLKNDFQHKHLRQTQKKFKLIWFKWR